MKKCINALFVAGLLYGLYILSGIEVNMSNMVRGEIVPQVYFFNEPLDKYEAGPILANDSVMVSLSGMAKMFHAEIHWDDIEWIATTRINEKDIRVQVFNKKAIVDGEEVQLDIAPRVVNGRMYIPLELMSDVLNLSMQYDEVNHIARIQ